jgi:hypothetical protein
MAQIEYDRMTVRRDTDIVVFLLGMRINSWWKLHRWLPLLFAMPRMLRELAKRPDSGFLGATTAGMFMVQYWESKEKLLAYASDRSGQHFPVWADFYRRVGASGDIGVWHETYLVPRGSFEAIYVNMPRTGLGKVSSLEPARGARSRAAGRFAPATT